MSCLRLLFAASLAVSGCAPTPLGFSTGEPCGINEDCTSQFCLPFPEGYCSADCTNEPCIAGEICHVVSGISACLKACGSREECRPGYMCLHGGCEPACTDNASCGKGFGCVDGECQPLPGKGVGERCANDDECSSRLCEYGTATCQIGCNRDGACPNGQTCFVNPVDTNNDSSTDTIMPICIPRRAGKSAVGSLCKQNGDCEAGQCLLGACVTLCEVSGNCPTMPPMACVAMIAQVDIGAPKVNACMFRSGTHTYDLGLNGTGPVGMPSNARAFNIFVQASGQNTAYYAGVGSLEDPSGAMLYRGVANTAEYLKLPVRYQPSEGTSMMLVSNAPARATVMPGLYTFSTFAVNQANQSTDLTARVRIKLGDAPPTSGSIPLHVFVTNLSGHPCGSFNAASAPQALAAVEKMVKDTFLKAGITLGPIKYFDSPAPNQVYVPRGGPSTQLNALLKQATANDVPDVLEMVMIKQITSDNNNFQILGISGGVPASTGVPGTVHSGVAVSLAPWCSKNQDGGRLLAHTISHELGHSMGLFHNVEQDGTTDAITDNEADGNKNLMFWAEDGNSGDRISPQQATVLLGNPAVR